MPVTLQLKSLNDLARLAASYKPSPQPESNLSKSVIPRVLASTSPTRTTSVSPSRRRPKIRPRIPPPLYDHTDLSGKSVTPSPPSSPSQSPFESQLSAKRGRTISIDTRLPIPSNPPSNSMPASLTPAVRSISTCSAFSAVSSLNNTSCISADREAKETQANLIPETKIEFLYEILSPSSKHLLTATQRALSQIPASPDEQNLDLCSRLWAELSTSNLGVSSNSLLTLRKHPDRITAETQTEYEELCVGCKEFNQILKEKESQYAEILEDYLSIKQQLHDLQGKDHRYKRFLTLFDSPVSHEGLGVETYKSPKEPYPRKPQLLDERRPKPSLTLEALEQLEEEFVSGLFDS
ncbi:hypothetical protein GEMRC1_012815 [Eukaryota sp. GEM-RC1]